MSDWQPILPPDYYRLIIHNCRRLMPKYKRQTANWVLVMEIFCVGSSYAWKVCNYAEIDGDGFDVGYREGW